METKYLKFIDFEKVSTLLEGFNKSTGFVTAILDLEGKFCPNRGGDKCVLIFTVSIPKLQKNVPSAIRN